MTSLNFGCMKIEMILRSLPAATTAEKFILGPPEIDTHSSLLPLKLPRGHA